MGLFLIWWNLFGTEHEKRGCVGNASRRSGVGASTGVTPTGETPWQRRGGTVQWLGILP